MYRHRLGKISFVIPQGFVGVVTRDCGDEVQLFSADKMKSIELRLENDCEEIEKELTVAVDELGEEIIQPIMTAIIDGVGGYSVAYKGCRTWYYELWLELNNCALRIVLRSCTAIDVAAAEECVSALDIRIE